MSPLGRNAHVHQLAWLTTRVSSHPHDHSSLELLRKLSEFPRALPNILLDFGAEEGESKCFIIIFTWQIIVLLDSRWGDGGRRRLSDITDTQTQLYSQTPRVSDRVS